MKKIWFTLKYLWFGFILGMKRAEDETLHQVNNELDSGTTINQGIHENSVAKALLRGELTQEVIDLRYRTYAVAKEAGHYNYFSPTLAKKKDGNDNKFIHIENKDEREVVTVQENKIAVETVTDSLFRIGADGKFVNRQNEYNIQFKRDNQPRFKLEDFTKKVVVKKGDDEWSAIIDVYVSKYPNSQDMKTKPFIKEVERIIDTGCRTDIFDILTISFETYKAYKLDDMIRFEFGDLRISEIIEFDGDYVIRFVSSIIDGGTDMTKEFYSERMAKKYENKEKKELTVNYDPEANIRTYRCADCGKEVTYDARALDSMNASDETTDGKTTEYLDYEMSEHVFGRMLCKECTAKAEKELYKKLVAKL